MAKKSVDQPGATRAKTAVTARSTVKKAAAPKQMPKATAANPPAKKPAPSKAAPAAAKSSSHPERNSDFPNTYIKEIVVSLDDPDHWVTLKWTGPEADEQETGPFRSSPGAGNKGTNCNIASTSQRSGSHCTPKGANVVQGFQRRLNSDSRAEYVTWFMRARGIAFHYFPTVPKYAASHGCVRLATKRVARLIQDNARIERTKVTVGGTWTKPAKQW